jgi:hypothetical protein
MSTDRHTRDIARTMASATPHEPRRDDARRRDDERIREEGHAADRAVIDERPTPIFTGAESDGYRTQWDAIQTGFVDEPRKAVQEADALVAQVIRRLSDVFADERGSLEHQWGRGDEVSTEELRLALRKYRSFFERLLSL